MAKTLIYRKKTLTSSRFIPALSLICIATGLILLLCFDAPNDRDAAAFVSEPSQKAESPKKPVVSAEEPPSASFEFEALSAPASAVADRPAEARETPAEAGETPAEAGETPAEAIFETIDAPEDGEAEPTPRGQRPVVAAAVSSAEKTPTASEEIPPPDAVDISEIDDYFSDALFIGASRTQGLLLYSNLGNASYYAAKGLTVEQVFKKPVVNAEGGKITVSDALGRRAFGKVYLMFGLNELGWNSADRFIEVYGLVLDRVRETQPDAVIYVQAVMPVSAWKSERDAVHNNPNIERCNERILRLAEEKNAIYLNVGEGVADENGILPAEASTDGIHLNRKYCVKWEKYLRAHEI
jgi:hypothetical protein